METIEEIKLDYEVPKVLRVLFFDAKGSGITERIMHRAVEDYSKVFLYSGLVTHCAIQLGSTYYEVAMDECISFPFEEEMLLADEVVGYFEISLEGMADDDLMTAKFSLDMDVRNNRRFNGWQCMVYLENYIRMNVDKWTGETGLLPYVNYNIQPGTFQRRMGDMGFHLPFTCATQVANLMNHLFGMEPAYDCHLPEAMFCNLEQLALSGYGEFFARDYLGVM